MAIFKDHKVRVNDLLGVIPESLISHLSTQHPSITTPKFSTVKRCSICYCTVFWKMIALVSERLKILLTILYSRFCSGWTKMKKYAGVLSLRGCRRYHRITSVRFTIVSMTSSRSAIPIQR